MSDFYFPKRIEWKKTTNRNREPIVRGIFISQYHFRYYISKTIAVIQYFSLLLHCISPYILFKLNPLLRPLEVNTDQADIFRFLAKDF